MTKKQQQPDAAVSTENQPDAEPLAERKEPGDPLFDCLYDWLRFIHLTSAAFRLHDELVMDGITTLDALARANVNQVRKVIMSALQADAQSLTGAAARYLSTLKE